MQLHGKNIFALVLIGLGALIILDKLGLGLGGLFGFIIPLLLIFLGYLGLKNDRAIIGTIILVIGVIALLGQFAGIIGFLIAAGLVIYGISLLRRNASI